LNASDECSSVDFRLPKTNLDNAACIACGVVCVIHGDFAASMVCGVRSGVVCVILGDCAASMVCGVVLRRGVGWDRGLRRPIQACRPPEVITGEVREVTIKKRNVVVGRCRLLRRGSW